MATANKKGNGWYADWRNQVGQRKRKLFVNKTLALMYESDQKLKIQKGEVGIVDLKKVAFEDFSKIYLEEYAKGRPSYQTDFHYMKSLDDFFGKRPLQSITESDVNRYKILRRQKVSPRTTNMCLSLLRVMFNKAKRHTIDGQPVFRGDNPVDGVDFFEEPERTRYLTVDEIGNLYAQCKGELLVLVKLAINTGMRRGEMYALTWSDVDIDAQVIRIRRSKSGRPRTIPMTLGALEAITSLPKRVGKLFLLTHRTAFENALENAGITDFHFHDLRHTFASHFIMRGGSQSALMEILGHASREMTDRYVSLSQDYHTRQISVMDSIWTPEQNVSRKQLTEVATAQ